FRAADGHVVLDLKLDSTRKPARTDIDVRLERLALSKLMKDSEIAEKSGGRVGGNAKLVGTGLSTLDILASATGGAYVVMSGGRISALLVERAGLDVFEAPGMLGEDKPIPFRGVVASLEAKNGRFGTRTLVFDTSDTKIVGQSYVDMRAEEINLLL